MITPTDIINILSRRGLGGTVTPEMIEALELHMQTEDETDVERIADKFDRTMPQEIT